VTLKIKIYRGIILKMRIYIPILANIIGKEHLAADNALGKPAEISLQFFLFKSKII
jgi:hypothetical protein